MNEERLPPERQSLSGLQSQGFEPRGDAYFNRQPAFMVRYNNLEAVEVYIHSYRDMYRPSKAPDHSCLNKAKPVLSV